MKWLFKWRSTWSFAPALRGSAPLLQEIILDVMDQRFAIVEPSLEPLAVETLRRAFGGIPGMASMHASMVWQ